MYKLQTECPICQKSTNSSGFISHLGQVHLQVEKYLPDYAKIPASVKGRSGQRYTRNRRLKLEAVVVRRVNISHLLSLTAQFGRGCGTDSNLIFSY